MPALDDGQERARALTAPIPVGGCTGQRFVAGSDRLSRIEVLVEAPADRQTSLRLLLKREGEAEPLRTAQVSAVGQSFARFDFSPVAAVEPPLTLCLETPQGGEARAWYADDVEWAGLPRLEGGVPVGGVLTFRLGYAADAATAASAAAAVVLRYGGLLAAALAVLLLPGLAIATWLRWPGDVALAAAPGLSLMAGAMVWWAATLVGVPLSAPGVGGVVVATTVAGAYRVRWRPTGELAWLGAAVGAALAVRLAVLRDLALPAWVDGVHHTYLTGLLVAGGVVPGDFGPLLPFGPFTYHFGFHAFAASAALLSGAPPADATLAAGQVLGAVAAAAAYGLARAFGASPRAGLAAALLAGLVSVMPAYYVSWSRFTQLAGLVALPAWLLLARRAGQDWPGAALFGLGSAALILIHPRVAVMAALLLPVDWLLRGPPSIREIGRLAAGTGVAAVAAAPWLLRVVGGLVPRLAGGPEGVEAVNALDLSPISTGLDPYLYGVAGATVAWGIVSRRRWAFACAAWGALALVAANPAWLGLPGSYMVSNGALVISLWLPACALAGAAIVSGVEGVASVSRPLGRAVPALLMAVAVAAAGDSLRAVNPSTVLATRADRRALEASARVLPTDARVAVNVREWQLRTYMGADAGYWIGVLTPGRALVPPLLYGLGPADWALGVSDSLETLERASPDPRQLVDRMRSEGAEWLFVGERGGAIDARRLTREAGFELVLAERGARLFRLAPRGPSV